MGRLAGPRGTFVLGLALLLGGVGRTQDAPVGGPYVDVLGHSLRWETAPRRIISLSPSITEILFAIGCDTSDVVGVTRFCNYPSQARVIARVGGIVDPSAEAILLLHPDLVLATRGNPLEFIETLVRLRIPVYAIEDRGDLSQVLRAILEVGLATGRAPSALGLVRELEARLGKVEEKVADLGVGERPRVYFGELEGALWTAGPGSYVDGLIRAAGGENIAARAPAAWCPLSLETVVAADPQVYLGTFLGPDTAEQRELAEQKVRRILSAQEGWRTTSLGMEPRIFLVHEDRLQRPGPRVFTVLEEFARFLHPERWDGTGGDDAPH